jgi:hypothetical protein
MPIFTAAAQITGDPMASIIPGRVRVVDPSSTIAFRTLLNWLQNCDEKHSCAPKNRQLPTRVLNVGDKVKPQSIVLVEPKCQQGQYITLSHCWGESHRIKTTESNLEAHKKGILLSTLPKTFQDAVLVARFLQIRYLWIDTLCYPRRR